MNRLVLILFFFLTACEDFNEGVYPLFQEAYESINKKFNPATYLSYRERNSGRDKILADAKKMYASEENCVDVDSCLDSCKEIYKNQFDREDCRDLPVFLVQRFQIIYDIFDNKTFEYIHEINLFDFKVFLSFSLEPSVRLATKLGASYAKNLLNRIAYDWDIARIFQEEDLDLIFLESLLNEIQIKPIEALGEHMKNEQLFQETALIRQNDSALLLVHNFLKQSCQADSNQAECVLSHYCSFSKNYKSTNLKEIHHFEGLKELLDKYELNEDKSHTLKSICPEICENTERSC